MGIRKGEGEGEGAALPFAAEANLAVALRTVADRRIDLAAAKDDILLKFDKIK